MNSAMKWIWYVYVCMWGCSIIVGLDFYSKRHGLMPIVRDNRLTQGIGFLGVNLCAVLRCDFLLLNPVNINSV